MSSNKTTTTVKVFLAALKPAIRHTRKGKQAIPILSNALLGNGTITSTDLDRTVITNLPCDFGEPLTFPIGQAMRVLHYETGDLAISLHDRRVTFEVNGGKWSFDSPGIANFPHVPEIPPPTITIAADKFKALIDRTQFAISSEESRYTLNGSLFDLKGNVLKLVATDGHRLAIAKLPDAPDGELRTLFYAKVTAWLKKHAKGDIGISTDDHFQFLATGDSTLISRKLSGNYPNYEAVLPTVSNTHVQFSANPFRRLRSVAFCADKRSGCIKWNFTEAGCEISARSDMGEASAPIDCAVTGTPVVIAWNADYVKDFLRFAAEEFSLDMKDGQTACIFSLPDFQYIIMPMRI